MVPGTRLTLDESNLELNCAILPVDRKLHDFCPYENQKNVELSSRSSRCPVKLMASNRHERIW